MTIWKKKISMIYYLNSELGIISPFIDLYRFENINFPITKKSTFTVFSNTLVNLMSVTRCLLYKILFIVIVLSAGWMLIVWRCFWTRGINNHHDSVSHAHQDPLNILKLRQNCRHFADDIWHAFSWKKMYEFRSRFHLSLLLSFESTVFQH